MANENIHDAINRLCREADRLAPRVAHSALESGCTDTRPTGPRQQQAWDKIAEAHRLNTHADCPANARHVVVLSEGEPYCTECYAFILPNPVWANRQPGWLTEPQSVLVDANTRYREGLDRISEVLAKDLGLC